MIDFKELQKVLDFLYLVSTILCHGATIFGFAVHGRKKEKEKRKEEERRTKIKRKWKKKGKNILK